MSEPPNRREFLKSVTALSAALPASTLAGAATAPPAAGHSTEGSAQSNARHDPGAKASAYRFLHAQEAAFLDAAMARLIPADELGPGAREAEITQFIDQQLASEWGRHARNYRQGPWPEGTPQQGYQSPLTPQEVYRAGIAETNSYCRAHYGSAFDALDSQRQDQVLTDLQHDAIALDSLSAALFFEMLLSNTREGFFADPLYGGNRDKIGWKLVGFPGVAAVYVDKIANYNEPYRVVPVSIAEVQQGLVPVDEHGHPRHTPLVSGKGQKP
jgi:gluconate 2-dehydrogenase gamma chain